ncbi:MAG: histone deacetylase [Deltaproteobacteria bacterium]|nr:histone deacetylase [Deltaproteobacteria bacterium]MBW2139827.1 histone deacetylase [Deltaproteobacteria bacterium]MBW2322177.1 histone deacetylase [Deltaproteobacteria bacterium]
MITREKLKQAIGAISSRDPEIGYSLNEMLSTGQLDVQSVHDEVLQEDDFYFLFQNKKIPVKKFQYLNDGIVAIEERLLIQYGELFRKQEFLKKGDSINFQAAVMEIREAGLKLMVTHEIDYAIANVRKKLKTLEGKAVAKKEVSSNAASAPMTLSKKDNKILFQKRLIAFLEKIKTDQKSLEIPPDKISADEVYKGVVDIDTPAYFIPFPFCLDSLMQVADLNLDFFYVRFLLNCLGKNVGQNLFACVVNRKIVGLIFIAFREKMFQRAVEIQFMATVRGGNSDQAKLPLPQVEGVGTLLVSGVWMLWKNRFASIGEIFLESEIGADQFYKSVGFQRRRHFEYVLKDPRGYLLNVILIMANNCLAPSPTVIKEINTLIRKQIKFLCQNPKNKEEASYRKLVVSFVKECLRSKTRPEFAKTAANTLDRYKNKIPDSEELLEFAAECGFNLVKKKPISNAQPLLVVYDDRFTQHLENIFHLENAKRFKAIKSVLSHAQIEGKWTEVAPRLASVEELAWVHIASHIDKIARTAGKPLASLDLDTQTTEKSYEVARLAVGAVFNLLDEIWSGKAKRGFAFIRPPGHHAEPDKAMGFCLFNNIALGARYLKERYAVQKVMIVDIDVHHGNGTQAAFYDTDEVLYFSMHQFPAYPGTGNLGEVGQGKGMGFTVNVPLGKGHGDKDFAQIIYFLANPLAEEYKPDMLLVSCGFDLYIHDRLSGMRGTPDGYAMITFLLLEIAEKVCEGRIAFIMEGGYSLKGIRECGLRIMQELCNASTLNSDKIDRIKMGAPSKLSTLKKVLAIQKKYWNL